MRDGTSNAVDDADRENEGDLIMAAEKVTPESMAFMIRHTSGVICMPLEAERLDELQLPLMVANNTEAQRTAFTVSVDAVEGTTTGISAADRAVTVRGLAERDVTADLATWSHPVDGLWKPLEAAGAANAAPPKKALDRYRMERFLIVKLRGLVQRHDTFAADAALARDGDRDVADLAVGRDGRDVVAHRRRGHQQRVERQAAAGERDGAAQVGGDAERGHASTLAKNSRAASTRAATWSRKVWPTGPGASRSIATSVSAARATGTVNAVVASPPGRVPRSAIGPGRSPRRPATIRSFPRPVFLFPPTPSVSK